MIEWWLAAVGVGFGLALLLFFHFLEKWYRKKPYRDIMKKRRKSR